MNCLTLSSYDSMSSPFLNLTNNPYAATVANIVPAAIKNAFELTKSVKLWTMLYAGYYLSIFDDNSVAAEELYTSECV